MVRWYDRIGNTIEMRVGNGWIKGIIVNGERTGDGIINMETEDGKKYWCGVSTEGVWYRKLEDSLGDLITQADRIRAMSDEDLAEFIKCPHDMHLGDCRAEENEKIPCSECVLQWLKSEVKEKK